jgi:apolipoprotein N-acyltransferase
MNPDAWRLRLRLPLALVSGGLAFLSLPPLDVGWASFGALVPLLLALRGARGRAGFLVGLVFGLAYLGPLVWWSSLFGYLAWSVLVVSQALFFAVFGWFAAWASRGTVGRLVGVPLMFAALEVLRTRWPFGGFAWGDLGYAQHDDLPLLPLARVGGVHAITLALVVVNAGVAELFAAGRVWRRALAVAIAGGVAVAPMWLPMGLAGPRAGELDVALVQGNVPERTFTGLGDRLGRRGPEDLTIIQNHIAATEPLAARPPNLIVWPENAIDRDPFSNPEVGLLVEQIVRKVGAPLIAGAITDVRGEPDKFQNTNLLYSVAGPVIARYDKIHLVPFGEYVPWQRLRRYVTALEQIPKDGKPGTAPAVFDLGAAKVGTVICFESTYPALVREFVEDGAQLLIVSTNNASFRRSPLARQHVAMSQLRAVEEGRYVMHAAISGITAVIDARGRIRTETPLFKQRVVRRTVPLARGRTPYGRFGDAIESALIGLGALAAVATLGRMIAGRRERRYADAEVELWGAEETLKRVLTEREKTDREIAERLVGRHEAPPDEDADR